jgi:hypothetical protein
VKKQEEETPAPLFVISPSAKSSQFNNLSSLCTIHFTFFLSFFLSLCVELKRKTPSPSRVRDSYFCAMSPVKTESSRRSLRVVGDELVVCFLLCKSQNTKNIRTFVVNVRNCVTRILSPLFYFSF